MKLYKYTEAQLRKTVKNSQSLRQVLLQLNVAAYGGNYEVLKKAIKHFHIDASHFTGQAWNKGKQLEPRQSIEAYLNNKATIQSYKLKNRLLKEKVFEHRCSNCKLTV